MDTIRPNLARAERSPQIIRLQRSHPGRIGQLRRLRSLYFWVMSSYIRIPFEDSRSLDAVQRKIFFTRDVGLTPRLVSDRLHGPIWSDRDLSGLC
jgi:hypothetical protein